MLIEFSVENFLSFKERATLSMVAAKDNALPPNFIRSAQGTNLNLLKSAVVYGANASGKSNLIDAIRFMRNFLRTSTQNQQGDTPIKITPFKLDAAMVSKPSTFDITFLWRGVRYNYGFSADSQYIHREWLFSYEKKKGRMLFERTQKTKKSEPQFRFSSYWEGERKRLAKRARSQALFLSVAAQFNNKLADNVMSWFQEWLKFISWNPAEGSDFFKTCRLIQREAGKKEEIIDFLKQADLGIRDFIVEKVPIGHLKVKSKLPGKYKKVMKDFDRAVKALDKTLTNVLKEISKKGSEPYELSKNNVITVHEGKDKSGHFMNIPFEFTEESDGTQKFFSLSGLWLDALEKGATLVVDELDVRLHSLLTKWLIQTFHKEELNQKGAQLIFTTHDASLLDKALFRRDQIWLTEKESDGATSLYSIWDFKEGKPRKEENLQKGYLAGRFGAIPILESWGNGR
ncbi:MAG: hypothetical protein A2V67_07565 [Deltaproteobacteria bacterium RBG_13_61_14]|nr:MAG: hypothetical protein A2V67_07565 [Deltaproteobacteria bacterium RBG_13_61_14]